MKRILFLLPALAAMPVRAHEVAADHSHVGEAVVFHASPLLVLGAGLAALIGAAFLSARAGRKARENRHDSR